MTNDCSHNTDPLKLVREGTSQDERLAEALDPAYAPVNEHAVAHNMVFARDYAALLKYFNDQNLESGDWVPFFGTDVSVQLAIAAIEDIDSYKACVNSSFDYLNNLENQANETDLKNQFGYLYAYIGTLAQGLDALKEDLPAEIALKGILQNLIQTQLAPALRRLIAYYKAGVTRGVVNAAAPAPAPLILRRPVDTFASTLGTDFSTDWSGVLDWATYASGIVEDASVYGDVASVFVQVNHCTTHNMFRSIFDQFLKVFSRVVGEANTSLDNTLTKWNKHEAHYALYLGFLRLLEYARTSSNTLTKKHLDFYYRNILGFKEKRAEPSYVHLLAELAKQVTSRDFKAGELFKAGKDDQKHDVFFANDIDLVANRAKVTARKTVYRHTDEPVKKSNVNQGRLYASPFAGSEDGLGAPLTSVTQSWHPFFNKVYANGALDEIRMPKADIGFAIASHYLWMAEGSRKITAEITVDGYKGAEPHDYANEVRCLVTTEKGWLEKSPSEFAVNGGTLSLTLKISGGDPPITPYSTKTHALDGVTFKTDLPMLLVKLNQDDTQRYAYSTFQDLTVTGIKLTVSVDNLKSLAISNDFGPVDSSKPFQPFGSSPTANSSLIIGSKEIFQKNLTSATVNIDWLESPKAYPSNANLPTVSIDFLKDGQWGPTSNGPFAITGPEYQISNDLDWSVLDEPHFSTNELYGTQSRHGFAKLKLDRDFGQGAYQTALIECLRTGNGTDGFARPPVGPTATELWMNYDATSELPWDTSDPDTFKKRPGQFFHLAPFGTAERHAYLSGGKPVHLLPQFNFERDNKSEPCEAEFYIGIDDLQPPQNLSLLFQVDPGTANPMVEKPPPPHIDWCYLKGNEWIEFAENDVQDNTGEMLHSGIVTLAMPREATNDNTLLSSGLFWVRAAVKEKSDAVCKLQLVAAQATQASFVDRGNSPDFAAKPLAAGTIKKLNEPDAAVKSISQPFASFGGRGAEQPNAFYTRVSERLRHKDRAIDLWDYERLVLEQFPEIYKVKCLNHTHYDEGMYRELAPGHVTVVTVPDLQTQNLRDPLKPYTSLDVLQKIHAFLQERTGCFVRLHVKNPQFEEVRAKFGLRLYDGYDETYYPNLLKQQIVRFLSPWAFTTDRAPSFGGKIYKSVLIDFIEDQPYVDYVTDFQLFQDINDMPGMADLDEVEGSRAVSILVSAPAGKHEIAIIKAAAEAAAGESCLCEA